MSSTTVTLRTTGVALQALFIKIVGITSAFYVIKKDNILKNFF